MIRTILGNGNPDMKRIVRMDKSVLSVMLKFGMITQYSYTNETQNLWTV